MTAKKPLISRQDWRRFWIISLVLAALAGGTTALVLVLNRPAEPQNLLPSQSPFKANVADTIPHEATLDDFLLPAPGGQWLSRSWLYSRANVTKWSLDEIRPYWTPAAQLKLLRLPAENAARIEQMFKDVP